MSKKVYNSILLVLLLLTVILTAEPHMTGFYQPGNWLYPIPDSDFESDPEPDNSLYGWCFVESMLVQFGYTHHFSYIKNLNDTITVRLIIKNNTDTTIKLDQETPEEWVMPYIYNSYQDLMSNYPCADTSTVDYALSHWERGVYTPTTQPDSIKPGEKYSMIFDMWNVPIGPHVVEFVNTSSAPGYFTMKRIDVGQYVYVEPEDIKDSINAYAMIGGRLLHRGASTAAMSWTDSILALDDSSIVGWNLRGAVYEALIDTVNAIDAYGRVYSIILNSHDPVMNLADSVATYEERCWAFDVGHWAEYRKYLLVTGDKHYYPR